MRRVLRSRWSYWPGVVFVFVLATIQVIATIQIQAVYEEKWFGPLDVVMQVATFVVACVGVGHGWIWDRYAGAVLCFAASFGAAFVPFTVGYKLDQVIGLFVG